MTTPTDTKFWQLLAFWRDSDPGAKREEAARAIDAHVQGLIDAPRPADGTTYNVVNTPRGREQLPWQSAHRFKVVNNNAAIPYVHARCECGHWQGGFTSAVHADTAYRDHLQAVHDGKVPV